MTVREGAQSGKESMTLGRVIPLGVYDRKKGRAKRHSLSEGVCIEERDLSLRKQKDQVPIRDLNKER